VSDERFPLGKNLVEKRAKGSRGTLLFVIVIFEKEETYGRRQRFLGRDAAELLLY
jgi:hypothetical protein